MVLEITYSTLYARGVEKINVSENERSRDSLFDTTQRAHTYFVMIEHYRGTK